MAPLVSNIDEAGENLRIRRGAIFFTLTIALVVALVSLGVPPLYRIALFVPFLGSLNLAYQGLFKT
jgi:hypothetical protein